MPLLKPLLLIAALLLTGCASMPTDSEAPQVNITSFSLAPDSANGPRFNIGVQIVNPDRNELRLVGMSYSIEIEGNRILSGAQNNLPVVAGFGTADLTITASPNLLGGVRLIADLMTGPGETLDYTFKGKLDAGGLFRQINIEESGNFNLPRQ